MRGFIAVLLIGLVGFGLVACGGVTFNSGPQSRNTIFTISGFVSVVQFTSIVDRGGMVISVTLVTFDQFNSVSTVSFCGTLGNQFFLDAFTVVDFTQGLSCATPLNITVAG